MSSWDKTDKKKIGLDTWIILIKSFWNGKNVGDSFLHMEHRNLRRSDANLQIVKRKLFKFDPKLYFALCCVNLFSFGMFMNRIISASRQGMALAGRSEKIMFTLTFNFLSCNSTLDLYYHCKYHWRIPIDNLWKNQDSLRELARYLLINIHST